MVSTAEKLATCEDSLYWHRCYSGAFDLINPESTAHPAKMSPALCYRILDHLKELNLLQSQDTVLDPMGGTGITAICAGANGYKTVTVELEEKFVGFQEQNKVYASRKLHKDLDWTIIKGDARGLSELLTEKGLVTVSSPPYGEMKQNLATEEDALRLAREMERANPKYGKRTTVGRLKHLQKEQSGYSDEKDNIGNLKDTPLKAITSPPYGDSKIRQGNKAFDSVIAGEPMEYSKDSSNIGNLPDKPLKTLTSPPYESQGFKCDENPANLQKREDKRREQYPMRPVIVPGHYGDTYENIGNSQGETYLSAMLQVYQEIAKCSDVLAIVLKNPTRNGKLRRLDLDTIELLKQSGWTIHCQHRALLFEELEHEDMFQGGSKKQVKGRMSFFKRLAHARGSPVASWEDVLICVRGDR